VLVRSLEMLGADVVFGIPGGAILPAYDPLFDSETVRHILVRHEQGAGHAATGYAQATGKVGVCMATSGPGATNLVTPIADAYMDSVGIVAITGQVPSGAIGTDAFQEADIQGITLPITKHNYLVRPARSCRASWPRRSTWPHRPARPGAGRHPQGRAAEQTTFTGRRRMELPGYHPTLHPHGKQIREAARLIATAAGRCSTSAAACSRPAPPRLRKLAELERRPVVTTLMARGAFPDSPPAAPGHAGMHGPVRAVYALQKADCVALGPVRRPGPASWIASRRRADRPRRHRPGRDRQEPGRDVPIVGRRPDVIDELITA
jgi:acetolactate synthase-1/2/3 large subunit